MKKHIYLLFFLLVPLFLAAEVTTLKVGVREVPPFSFKDSQGNWKGMTVELWESIAAEKQWPYIWIEEDSVEGLFSALDDQEIDLIASGITLTQDREIAYDFTHTFLSSNLAILAHSENESQWLTVIKSFISWPFFLALGSLSLVLLSAGAAVYLFERKANPEEFSPQLDKGLLDAFWWAAVTMTTVGYGDKSPKSAGGRLVALFWMFISVIILSTFTASIVSALDEARSYEGISSIEDLVSGRVASIPGTIGESFLESEQLRSVSFDDFDKITQAIQGGSIDAFVYDKPILQFLVKGLNKDFYLVDLPNERENYGIVLTEGSPLREPINHELLSFLKSPQWLKIEQSYTE